MPYNKLLVESERLDKESRINFIRMSGIQGSSYEHLVPELLFTTLNEQAYGSSAVKALSIAASEGQKIFTLTKANLEQLNNTNIDTDVRIEIQNAVISGKAVTVHEKPINIFGWNGTGYAIIDPNTGAGAYKISGGANGGFVQSTASRVVAYGSVEGSIPFQMTPTYLPIIDKVIASFVRCVIDFLKENALLILLLAFLIALVILAPQAGLILTAVGSLGTSSAAFSFNEDTAASCTDDEFCYMRWEDEDSRCYSWSGLGSRVVAACKTRAAIRRDLCIRNGGIPDPNEPPEYNPFVDFPR